MTEKGAGCARQPAPLLMEAAMRKYNKIISCTRTENGAWRLIVQTPNDQFHSHLYIGWSKKNALAAARRTDFDKQAGLVFNRPPSRRER